ncbi:AI-2E family transporter [bacterium]|nr:AI-2E family transporter [bacterium]
MSTTKSKSEQGQDDPTPKGSSLGRNMLTFLAALGIVIGLWLIVQLKPIVVLVVISTVFAAGLAPAVARIERTRLPRGRKIPRALAILIVYIGAAVLALAVAALIVVPVVTESVKFSQNLPEYMTAIKTWLAGMHHRFSFVPDYAGLVDKAKSQIDAAGQYVISSAPAVFGFLGSVIAFVSTGVMTFYMLLTHENIRRSFLSLIPPKQVDKVGNTLSLMSATVGGWLRGQITLAVIVGVLVTGGMLLLQVPYAAVIGVVGAVGEVIPMVGPVAAAVPAVLIALFGPTWQLVGVIIFFILLTQTENNLLAPKIMQKHVGISPLVTIIALLSGATLLGIVGALLAIPVAAAGQVLMKEIIVPAIRNGSGRHKW